MLEMLFLFLRILLYRLFLRESYYEEILACGLR
jgi:hypothetical protein